MEVFLPIAPSDFCPALVSELPRNQEQAPSQMTSRVQTTLGAIDGVLHPDGSASFLGIRYAVPPLGERRFAPAERWTEPWTGVLNATRYGAPCHQTAGSWDEDPSEHPNPSAPRPSEDCLSLNMYVPPPNSDAEPAVGSVEERGPRLPMLVWIHGGGLCGGSGSSAWTHGDKLARHGRVIVATLNYRLGPLGFLAHPELRRAYGGTGGMNGMHDQIVALQWLKQHAAAFGGDANAITVMGESSGGVSVCILNASPRARGLFRRAIVQSGPCVVPSQGWGPATLEAGLARGVSLAHTLGAPTLAELRSLPPQRLQWDNAT